MEVVDLGIEGLSDCKEIGSGGFSRVYAGTEDSFGRTVAIKVLENIDDAGRRRFEREQLTMGRMAGHVNAVTPHSSGYTASGLPYLVMEYMPGGSLADLVASDGCMSWEEAASYLLPVADALGYGHSQGIVHRDVKPANILIGVGGIAKLADFGISAIRESTATQTVAFSLEHAPPETFKGGQDRRDERSDLYSLASTLYSLVVGVGPYHSDQAGDDLLAYVVRIAEHPIPTVGDNFRHNGFLRHALAKDPDARPRTASQFVEALTNSLEPLPLPPPPPPPRSPTQGFPAPQPSKSIPPHIDEGEWWRQD